MLVLPGDVTDRAGMEALVERIERNHGPIALAFLNAGVGAPDSPGDIDPDLLRQTFAVNVEGVINGLRPVLRYMKQRARGQIAVNASIAGYGGLPRGATYGASKAALIHLCESLKFDLDRHGLSMQIVNEGFVHTPLTDRQDIPMPFKMQVGEAARRIVDGFEAGGFEISFPKRLVWPAKFANLLPYWLYFAIIRRAAGPKRKRR